jgi:hypothetical protein
LNNDPFSANSVNVGFEGVKGAILSIGYILAHQDDEPSLSMSGLLEE